MEVKLRYHWPEKSFNKPQPVFTLIDDPVKYSAWRGSPEGKDTRALVDEKGNFFAWYDAVKDSCIDVRQSS